MSSTDALQSHIQNELDRIVLWLESRLGRKSRWTGDVVLSDDPSFQGKMAWNGDIAFQSAVVQQDVGWRTIIHEALHTFSLGLTHLFIGPDTRRLSECA